VLVAGGDVAGDLTALQRPVAVFQDGRRVVYAGQTRRL
jgi:hypothetical protein